MKNDQIAINSVSTKQAPLEECLAAYSTAGFTKVEFMLGQVREYLDRGNSITDLKQLLDDHRIRCIGGFDCSVECFSARNDRARNHDQIVENARLVAELGGSIMVVGTAGPEDIGTIEDPLAPIVDAIGELAGWIEPLGVTICLEFNWSPIVKSLWTAADIARRTGRANAGVLFDPAHYHCTPTKFDQLNAANVALIRHVHVDDMRDKPGELSHCNDDRVLPGQGCLDLPALISQLGLHGYDGYFSIEMFSEGLWAMPASEAARLMYGSMAALCEPEG